MKFDCEDLERALAVPELLPDAREHARTCEACRRELWLWSEVSRVAPALREEWESPELWPRIRETLAAEQRAVKPRCDWRMLGGIAAAIVAAVSVFVLTRPQPVRAPAAQTDNTFLTEQALQEVERTEAAYRASIEKLARLAQPVLTTADNPATVADREKLLVLDSEIASVRTTVSQNRFNTEVQTELAALYKQKQDTLKEILQRGQEH